MGIKWCQGKRCVWFFSSLNWRELESRQLEGMGAGKEEQGRARTSHAPQGHCLRRRGNERMELTGTLSKYSTVMQKRVMDHKETVISTPVVDCISAHSWVLELNTSLLTLQMVLLCWEENLSNEYWADAFAIMET